MGPPREHGGKLSRSPRACSRPASLQWGRRANTAESLYDELVVGELCEFMRRNREAFDVVLSADTLCYFGALEEALAAAHVCLRPGGLLLFTVERWTTPDPEARYCMQVHGRYAHAASYVRSALAASGFRVVELREEVLRSEIGADVGGLVAAAVR